MDPAPAVALVVLLCAVLDEPVALAVLATAPERGEQPVELGCQLSMINGDSTNQRFDVFPDLVVPAPPGARCKICHFHEVVEHPGDRGVRPRSTLFINFVEEPGQRLFGSLLLPRRTGWYDFVQVERLPLTGSLPT
ncbi:hypothetical protein [Labedaea rhizosphaerae]|uniref:hypothetical protein n=1 Tax=Labedaea rhizosphaerae TaxID=598644 RepID=UPI0014152F04|nr:hypothetical protein [Labedaea rhizosphaerae]